MIPVFQTRTSTETLGNCLEACLASILETELAEVPDRGAYLPAGWAELVAETRRTKGDRAVGELMLETPGWDEALRDWLRERGLGLLELEIGNRHGISEDDWLELVGPPRGYWIGTCETKGEGAHACVWQGASIVHNPHRGMLGAEGLGRLISATVLLAYDPRQIGLRWAREVVAGAEPIRPALELVGAPAPSRIRELGGDRNGAA